MAKISGATSRSPEVAGVAVPAERRLPMPANRGHVLGGVGEAAQQFVSFGHLVGVGRGTQRCGTRRRCHRGPAPPGRSKAVCGLCRLSCVEHKRHGWGWE